VAEERYGLLLGREAVYDITGQRTEQAADLAALTAAGDELAEEEKQRHCAGRSWRADSPVTTRRR